jgi:hypothetical protein
MVANTKITLKESKLKSSKRKEKDARKITAEIWKNAGEWFDYYSDNITKHREDFDFTFAPDGQWTSDEISEANQLAKFGKTRLTFNMMFKVVNTLCGEYAEVDPEYEVRNTDTAQITEALTKKINVMSGLMRSISKKSKFDNVKESAFLSAVGGGFGAYCIGIEREKKLSFNKEPRFKVINDPTTCFWDRTAQNEDKLDGKFVGRCYIWKKEAVKDKYRVEIGNSNAPISNFDTFTWLTEDDTIIVDYYKKTPYKRSIALLSNGQTVDLDKAQIMVKESKKSILMPELEILEEDTIDDYKIHFYRVVEDQILEDEEWPGTKLPIVYQGGIALKYRGKEYTFSAIRFLRDAQRAYNYARNETIYRIKKLRNEPYLASDGNIKGHEEEWKNAHLPRAVLKFREVPSGFVPRREPAGDIPQALIIETQTSFNDIQQILGRFEANQGAQSNELTGRAQAFRQMAGNLSIKKIYDNAEAALQTGADILLDLLPKIYDNQRIVQTIDENGKSANVQINGDDGIDLTDGQFEVDVTVGASFELQRQIATELLLKAYGANPAYAQISADIFAKNLDIKDAALLANRARTYLQPQITQDEATNQSQDKIIQRNQQQAQQWQQAQQQLVMRNMQLDQMVKQNKMQDDRIKALSNQVSAMADMMNARTNQAKAQQEGVISQQRTQAEMTKAVEEERTARLKLAHEALKARTSESLFG